MNLRRAYLAIRVDPNILQAIVAKALSPISMTPEIFVQLHIDLLHLIKRGVHRSVAQICYGMYFDIVLIT